MTTKVLITGAIHPTSIDTLKQRPHLDVDYMPDMARSALDERIGDIHVLVTRSETAIDRALLERAQNLKLVVRAAVGVGNIDLAAATERGVLVVNTPGKNTNSAAELAFGLLLSLTRRLPAACEHIKSGGWDRHRFAGHELRGRHLGLVGLGNVGHRVAKFARGFDMEVAAFDPYLAPKMFARYQVKRFENLQDMLPEIDILSVHVPLNKETRGMVGDKELRMLKKGALVVNSARGGIIDENALLECLRQEHLGGAAIDTWEGEPEPRSDLVTLPNVVCTPHIGASTEEAQAAIGACVVEQIDKALSGGVVDYPVNMPQIGLTDSPLAKPYTILAEKLGSLAAQLIHFNAVEFEIAYRGDLAEKDQGLVKLGLQKGFTARILDATVSYVNSEHHFRRLGLKLRERHEPTAETYRSAIRVTVRGGRGDQLVLSGIVFDEAYIRISGIDGFQFEAEPSGNYLIVRNQDKPGVIGDIGAMLAREHINIDSFTLSRQNQGGQAMALVKVDGPINTQLCESMKTLPNIDSVESVDL